MPEPMTHVERRRRLYRLQFDLIYLMGPKPSERLRQARKLLNDEYNAAAEEFERKVAAKDADA